MLEIKVPEIHETLFNNETSEFTQIDIKETVLRLEHSLISLQKWEQKYNIPFLATKEKTIDQFLFYVKCMTLNHDVDSRIYRYLSSDILNKILNYMEKKMTAAWFNDGLIGAQKTPNETVTSEIIYYWMISLNIPIEFQKWHLEALLTLIKVVSLKNDKPKKKDPRLAAAERNALNEKRRAKYKSKG